MKKKWELYEANNEKVYELSKKYNIHPLVARVLVNREIEEEKIAKFLNPKRDDFYNPFLMPDMEKAVNRILRAMKNGEKTIVYGDYDVDGITSITVLKRFLKDRGFNIDYYIPNRLEEGYGLNNEAIKKIADEKYKLIITVDCGISAVEEIEYAKELGMDVVVTDHHEPGEDLPKAIAVVDAKRKDSKYPFNGLAGVGVTFKVIQAISQKLNLEDREYLKYLDIVCVGTISDIVPLIDENRVISSLGLKLVNQTKNVGLRSLLRGSNYTKVDETSISFGIAPRINACGRMGFENEAMRLFITENIVEADTITRKMNQYNTERQEIEKKIYKEVLEEAEKEKEKSCIILGKENWHHGIIGIVSSKVTEKLYKPSILVCFEGDEGKGSGRSVHGFDLYNAVSQCSSELENFGGHEMAVGLSVNKENFSKFKERVLKIADEANVEEMVPVVKVDAQLELKNITIPTVEQLKILEPYGANYSRPLFLVKNLKITSITTLSEGKHLKIVANDNEYVIHIIGFGKGELAEDYQIGDRVDIVGNLDINEFRNYRNVQLVLRDMRNAAPTI